MDITSPPTLLYYFALHLSVTQVQFPARQGVHIVNVIKLPKPACFSFSGKYISTYYLLHFISHSKMYGMQSGAI